MTAQHFEIRVVQGVVSGPFQEHTNRCETCAYFEKCSEDFLLLSSHFSHDPSVISSLQGLFMTLMALKGCASHSSQFEDGR